MTTEVLTRHQSGSVLIATLNRPSKANSLSRDLLQALSDLIYDIETINFEDEVRVLILTGMGSKAFCAGADINELNGISYQGAVEQMRFGQNIFERLEKLPIPVIAAVNASALGGGLELAMAADIRIVHPLAQLGQPEILLANLPGWGGTQRLPRLVGRGIANEMIFTGKSIDAERAYQIGLANFVADKTLEAAVDMAKVISKMSTNAIRGAKLAIEAGFSGGFSIGSVVEAHMVGACVETNEQRAAVEQFLNRKKEQ